MARSKDVFATILRAVRLLTTLPDVLLARSFARRRYTSNCLLVLKGVTCKLSAFWLMRFKVVSDTFSLGPTASVLKHTEWAATQYGELNQKNFEDTWPGRLVKMHKPSKVAPRFLELTESRSNGLVPSTFRF